MKQNRTTLLSLLAAAAFFVGCTPDFDRFGDSDYHLLKELSFEEQSGSTRIDDQSGTAEISIEQGSRPDSLTLESLKLSPLAKLHLVTSALSSFPTTSKERETLALTVSLDKKPLSIGSRLALPAKGRIYFAAVSESGLRTLWKLQVEVLGLGTSSSSSGKSSSSTAVSSSSQEEPLEGQNDFSITFEGQLSTRYRPGEESASDTLEIRLPIGADLTNLSVKDYNISKKATIDPDPKKLTDFSSPIEFQVTAENGKKQGWILIVIEAEEGYVASSEKKLLSIAGSGQSAPAEINSDTVHLHFDSVWDLDSVQLTLTLSEYARSLPHSGDWIDLRKVEPLIITAEDGSRDTLQLKAIYPEPLPPRILSFSSGDNLALFDTTTRIISIETGYLEPLEVPIHFELSLGAEITGGVENNSTVDLSRSRKVALSNGIESVEYTLQAGYQVPLSSFDDWNGNKIVSGSWIDPWSETNFTTMWDNGNQTVSIMTKPVLNGSAAEMTTNEILGKIASGNLFTGIFNPKGVGLFNLASYKDGNELIDFGRPFTARPTELELTLLYQSVNNDSCDVYIVLENRDGRGSNISRTVDQENKMVASAWYRSPVDNDESLPDVLSISEPNSDGLRTMRLRLKYGEPHPDSPIWGSSVFATTLKHTKGIFNSVSHSDNYADEEVTHLRIVVASSAAGQFYRGSKGAKLTVGGVKLIYGTR